MKCEHAQEFLSEYVTGEMDRALAVSLENHLRACDYCTQTVEGLRSLWRTLDDMPVIEPPDAFHSAVMERIAAEQMREERVVRTPVRAPSWRGVLQPRVFAYAAVAVVLLLGAEFVQVQRASLGPLGLVLNVLHPVQALQSQRVAWTPNGQGGGTLTVTLQAHAQVNGAECRRHARIRLQYQPDGPIDGLVSPITRDFEIRSDRATVVTLPLAFTPRSSTDNLDVTVTPLNSSAEEGQTIALPLPSAP